MEAVAKLRKSPIAPRKMRLVADLIRGVKADKAFAILKNEPKKCAIHLEKLLLAAVASWQQKNQDTPLGEAELYIKTIHVDSAGMLKRLRPAPQGRAHRIRKRFNHVTLIVDKLELYKDSVLDSEIAVDKQTKNQEKKTNGTKS
ncbi:MAG: 50S ribosomal protein L22 [Candidatus Amoebophilus sp. 36-38]|nr:MAG: 50S ribosomal protein L22 [Candidatus Amoebophilus sp. 36-38]